MRVLVCGGRDYHDVGTVDRVLSGLTWSQLRDALHRNLLIHGNARGADLLADAWARSNGIPACPIPAQWSKYGKRAGPIRNQNMLGHRPDVVVAFPGGRGTADMVRRAKAVGIKVIEVPVNSPGEGREGYA